jgi:hypothetical protein
VCSKPGPRVYLVKESAPQELCRTANYAFESFSVRSRNGFYTELSDLFLEFMIANLLTSAVEKNDPNFEEFRQKVSALVSENEAHASKIPWVARIVEPKRRH